MNPLERLYLDALDERPPRAAPPRAGLLAAARGRRGGAPAAPDWVRPYADRVAAMDAVLASAAAGDWRRTIVEGWTLQELIAHLLAKDALVAADVGAPVVGPAPDGRDPLVHTALVQRAQDPGDPERTRLAWREQAEVLCARLADTDQETRAAPDGVPIPVRDAILARALETWMHADDGAGVLGVRLPPPVADRLHPMAGFCARLMPLAMRVTGVEAVGRTVRLTLTGPGGGTWMLPLDAEPRDVVEIDPGRPDERVDAEITADTAGFCFLVAGRGDPGTFPAEVTGDHGLAADLLRAAPAFAGP